MLAATHTRAAFAAALLVLSALVDRAAELKLVDSTQYQNCKADSTCTELCVVAHAPHVSSRRPARCASARAPGAARWAPRVPIHPAARSASIAKGAPSLDTPSRASSRSCCAPVGGTTY